MNISSVDISVQQNQFLRIYIFGYITENPIIIKNNCIILITEYVTKK